MFYAEVKWEYPYGSHPEDPVKLIFINHMSGVTTYRYYKTRRAAQCAETKFLNRMSRIYFRQEAQS